MELTNGAFEWFKWDPWTMIFGNNCCRAIKPDVIEGSSLGLGLVHILNNQSVSISCSWIFFLNIIMFTVIWFKERFGFRNKFIEIWYYSQVADLSKGSNSIAFICWLKQISTCKLQIQIKHFVAIMIKESLVGETIWLSRWILAYLCMENFTFGLQPITMMTIRIQ